MKNLRKFLALLLALCMLTGMLGTAAFAAGEGEEDTTETETVACTKAEGCTAETHEEGCPLYVKPENDPEPTEEQSEETPEPTEEQPEETEAQSAEPTATPEPTAEPTEETVADPAVTAFVSAMAELDSDELDGEAAYIAAVKDVLARYEALTDGQRAALGEDVAGTMDGLRQVAELADATVSGTMTGAALLGKAVDGVITLNGDVTLTSTMTVNKDITLELSGYTLCTEDVSGSENSYYVQSKTVLSTSGAVSLTVKGGTVKAGTVTNSNRGPEPTIKINGNATLIVDNATVKGGAAVQTEEGGNSYKSTGGGAISTWQTNTVIIRNGSTVEGGNGKGYGSAYISGGKNQAEGGKAISMGAGTLTITDSTVTGGSSNNYNAEDAISTSATTTITNSAVTGGTAGREIPGYGIGGDAISVSMNGADITVENSTIAVGAPGHSWAGICLVLPNSLNSGKNVDISLQNGTKLVAAQEGDPVVSYCAGTNAPDIQMNVSGTVTVSKGKLANKYDKPQEISFAAQDADTKIVTEDGATIPESGIKIVPPEGAEVVKGEDGNITFAEKEPVATVGEQTYFTLQAAIGAAGEGDTIKLLKNVTLDSRVTVGNIYSGDKVSYTTANNITLDLGGHTLTGPEGSRVLQVNDSVFTLKNGTVQGVVNDSRNAYTLGVNSGTLNLNGIKVADVADASCIYSLQAFSDRSVYTVNVENCDLCPSESKTTTYLSTAADEECRGGTVTVKSGKIDSSTILSCTIAKDSMYDPDAQTVYNAAEWAELSEVAEADGKQYPSIAAANFVSENVKLLSDIDLGKKLNVKKDLTLDLNGYTLKAVCKDSTGAVEIGSYNNPVTFSLTDSSANKSGALELNLNTDNYQNVLKVVYGSTFELDGAKLKVTGTMSGNQMSALPVITALQDTTVILNGTVENEAENPTNLWLMRLGTNNDKPKSVTVTGGTYFDNSVTHSDNSDPKTITDFVEEGLMVIKRNGQYAVGTLENLAVAQVGETKYLTLQTAIDDTTEGTVKLLKDATESVTVAAGKNITLDLAGKTLNGNFTPNHVLINKGTLVIEDSVGSGKITRDESSITETTKKAHKDHGYIILNAGTLTLNGGTIEGKCMRKGNPPSTICNGPEKDNIVGKLIINDGATVYAELGIAVKNDENGTLEMNGGTVKTNAKAHPELLSKDGFNAVQNWKDATIIGGNINGDVGTWTYGSTNAKTELSGTVVVNGDVCTDSKTYTATNVPQVEITGGEIKGSIVTTKSEQSTVKVSGGTFSSDVNDYCVADKIAVEKNAEGKFVVETLNATNATAQVGDSFYKSLQAAIDATQTGTVKLLKSTSESVTVAEGKDITLDLNGKTLTNRAGEHTITNNGTLSFNGDGTVDNVSHGKAALLNNGTATLNGGTFTRSKENGQSTTNNGGNSYYTIDNKGTMTINGATVKQDGGAAGTTGKYSSLIRNLGNAADNTAGTLTIENGTFSGGLNTVKNDDYGTLTIRGGSFSNTAQHVIMNWNVANISGGTFTATTPASSAVWNGYWQDGVGQGELNITGGEFIGTPAVMNAENYSGGTVTITDGLFSTNVSEYCENGKAAFKDANGKWTIKGAEGTITVLTNGGTVDGNTVTFGEGVTMVFASTGNDDGRTPDKWYAGIKVTAPEGVDINKATIQKIGAWWLDDGSSSDNWVDASGCKEDGQIWPMATPAYIKNYGKGTPKTLYNRYRFDWNADGDFDQEITLKIVEGVGFAQEGMIAEVNGIQYPTLAEAVADANAGDTVTLLKNATGSGVIINKNITIDFGGFTYTVAKAPLAGSGSKYATQAFQLLAGADKANPNTVVMKNGTIVLPEATENLKMGIQNYTNLTLDNMKLDASANSNITYVVSNNNGSTTITGGTVIKAAEGKVAFDVYDYSANGYGKVSVTVEDAEDPMPPVEIVGKIEVSESNIATLTVKGGKFDTDVSKYVVAGKGWNSETGAVEELTVTLNRTAARLTVGYRTTTVTLEATTNVTPADATVTWTSSNTDVVTVSDAGVVTPVGSGTATVTATVSGKTATCTVNVTRTYAPYVPPVTDPDEELEDPDVPLAGLPFVDVERTDWFFGAISSVYLRELMIGISGTEFGPEMPSNRGTVATILHRMENTPDAEMNDFADVLEGKWYTPAINWANQTGVMIGYDTGVFQPEAGITREQLALTFFRYYKKIKGAPATERADLSTFADSDRVSAWAREAMEWAVGCGLLKGTTENQLVPQGLTKRSELAAVLERFLEMD